MNFKFLMIMCMAILLVGSVSAFEFDNVKSYDSIMREVTITNAYGIGSEIGKARLNTPLNVKVGAGYQKVAEFDLWAYDDYNDALKQFTFTDLKNKKEINRDFDLKYLTYKNIEINDYKNIQVGVSGNGTAIYEYQIVGSHFEEREVWNKITSTNLLKNERLTIGIFTDVKVGDYVDWIPTIYGVEVEEWANWEASLNIDLRNWYYANETSGARGIDTMGTSDGDLTSITLNQVGLIDGEGVWGFDVATSSFNMDTGTISSGASTVSYWIKTTSTESISKIIFYDVDGGSPGRTNLYDNGVITMQSREVGGSVDCTVTMTGKINDGEFHNIVTGLNSSHCFIYVDGEFNNSATATTTTTRSNNDGWRWGDVGVGGFNSIVMDFGIIGIWTRTLTSGEISNLYNEGTPVEINGTDDKFPNIILNSPSSANYTTAQSPTINFTASDDINLSSVKLYVNDVLNQTNASGINNSVYLFDLNLGDGDYTIYGKATDNESQETNSSEIRIVIDSTAPTITLNTPTATEITSTLPKNSTLNTTTADTHLSACWYYTSDNSTNITYTCNTETNVSFNTGGLKTIYTFVNDTFGNENSTSTTYLINYIQETATFDATVVEAESNLLILNITASNITTFNATLHYNGTDYTPIIVTTGNTSIITSTLTVPSITANELIYFNWTYTLNGVDYNSSNYNQTILFLTPLVISASCDDKALRFDIQDETNLSALTGDIEYNFKYGISNGSLKSVFGSLTDVTTFYACINATVSENYTLGYGEIQYRDNNYVDRRYYLFEGQIISNNTLTNHTLRDLISVDQTSFLLTMEDTSLNVYAERYTALWRWYPDLDEYQIVEMGKTDDDGETVAHVETEDVDYRVGLYETDGSLIALDNPRRFVCTSSPCSLTIRVGAGDVDYSSVFDVQTLITYNATSKVFLVVYNDPNQLTSKMRFLVTRSSGTNTLIICDDTSSGFSGVMSCNTSAYTGLKKAVLYRSASPELPIDQKVVSEANTTFNSGFGLFISMMLWLAIVLSGFSGSPIPLLILSVVGLIPALLIGSINIAIFTGIATLGAIIIHFIKRAVAR